VNRFEIRTDSNGQYYWRFVSSNNKVICWTESYHNKQDAIHSLNLIKQFAGIARIDDFT